MNTWHDLVHVGGTTNVYACMHLRIKPAWTYIDKYKTKYKIHTWIMHKVQTITCMKLRMNEIWIEMKCVKIMHNELSIWNVSHT